MAESLPSLLGVPTVSNSNTDTGVDIVVVIDRSGTMPKTDPNNLALTATKMLAEISSVDVAGTMGGVNMALITYGYSILTNTNGFYDISDKQQLQEFEAAVMENEAVNVWEDTNTGLALDTAYQLIQAQRAKHPDHVFAIVLLSDGEVDIATSDGFLNDYFPSEKDAIRRDFKGYSQSGQTNFPDWRTECETRTQESIAVAERTAEGLAQDGIKLHCIGIKSEDFVRLGTDMQKWVETTGGVYDTVDSIDGLSDKIFSLYQQINRQAQMTRKTIGNGRPAEFDVGEGVLQVNISVKPQIADISTCSVSYTTPDNQSGQYPLTQDNCTNYDNAAEPYSILKLTSPKAGHYTIGINDNEAHEYDLVIVSIYDLKLQMLPVTPVSNGEITQFKLEVTKDGTPYYDVNQIPTLTILDAAGNELMQSMPLSWNDSEKLYEGTFTASQAGSYQAYAKLNTQKAENISERIGFEVTAAPIRPLHGIGDIAFTGHAVVATNANGEAVNGYAPYEMPYSHLESCFENLDHRVITGYRFSITDAQGGDATHIVSFEDTGDRLILTPKQATNGTLNLTLQAEYDSTVSDPVTGTVMVEDAQAPVALSAAGQRVETDLGEKSGLLPMKPEVVYNNLSNWFVEPNANDGEGFAVRVEVTGQDGAPTKALEASIASDALSISGMEEGDALVRVIATSTDGSSAEVTLTVTVVNKLKNYIMLGAVVLGAILLMVIIIVAIGNMKKPKFSDAVLSISLYDDGDVAEGTAMLRRYGKKEVKLSTICSANHIQMGAMRSALDKIIIKPAKGGGIIVRRNAKGGKKESTLRPMDNWKVELGDDREIELDYDEN